MTKTPKMTLKKDNPKEAEPKKEKKVEYPMWPGMENAELGVKYRNARGNIIQRGSSNG
jgi:hypothetical protein